MVVVVAMFSCMVHMVRRERRGAPLFSKLEDISDATARAGGSKAMELPVVVGDRQGLTLDHFSAQRKRIL